ncbi:MAG: hypothetical protein RMJ88_17025, partial [Thermogemmata sp.]|nr:hypothetical protein [Thermogemmata sp.]
WLHSVKHGLPQPGRCRFSLLLRAFNHDFVVHGQHGKRPGAVVPPLPQQAQCGLQPVGPRALHRRIEPLGEPLDVPA